jgi:hypothetical protein
MGKHVYNSHAYFYFIQLDRMKDGYRLDVLLLLYVDNKQITKSTCTLVKFDPKQLRFPSLMSVGK